MFSCNIPHLLAIDTALIKGLRVAAIERGIALRAGRSRVRFPVGSLGVFIDFILLASL